MRQDNHKKKMELKIENKKQWIAWELLTQDNGVTEIGYGGSAHSGKTYLGCSWITVQAIAYPETHWMIGRNELTNLKRTTVLTLFEVFKNGGVKGYTYNQQNNTITLVNGSIIFLLDLAKKPSDPLYTRLGGLELTGAFIDEAAEVPIQAIEVLKTRIGRKNNAKYGLKPKLLETFNPDKGHVYARYYKPHKENTLPSHRRFIFALPRDNPHTTDEYIKQLENADIVTRERLLFGNFDYDNSDDRLMSYDSIQDIFTNTIDTGEPALVVDVARFGKDTTVFNRWSGLISESIEIHNKVGTDFTAQRIRDIARDYRIPYSRIIVDEDGIGGGVVDTVKGIKGFVANSSPQSRYDGKVENFINLKSQCAYRLADKITHHLLACTVQDINTKATLSEELDWIRSKDRDKDGKLKIMPKEEVKQHLGRSPDISDTFIMRMALQDKVTTPNTASNLLASMLLGNNPNTDHNNNRSFR